MPQRRVLSAHLGYTMMQQARVVNLDVKPVLPEGTEISAVLLNSQTVRDVHPARGRNSLVPGCVLSVLMASFELMSPM